MSLKLHQTKCPHNSKLLILPFLAAKKNAQNEKTNQNSKTIWTKYSKLCDVSSGQPTCCVELSSKSNKYHLANDHASWACWLLMVVFFIKRSLDPLLSIKSLLPTNFFSILSYFLLVLVVHGETRLHRLRRLGKGGSICTAMWRPSSMLMLNVGLPLQLL